MYHYANMNYCEYTREEAEDCVYAHNRAAGRAAQAERDLQDAVYEAELPPWSECGFTANLVAYYAFTRTELGWQLELGWKLI